MSADHDAEYCLQLAQYAVRLLVGLLLSDVLRRPTFKRLSLFSTPARSRSVGTQRTFIDTQWQQDESEHPDQSCSYS